MGYEISQFDIHDRQLWAGDPEPKTARSTDIGEAKVTRTLFGRAKVRVVRAQDRKRRAWMLMALLAIAAAIVGWEGWVIVQRVENEPPPVPLSERIWVSPPVFRPANILPDPHPGKRNTESLIQSEIDSMLSGPLPRHPPPGLKAKTSEKTADSATGDSDATDNATAANDAAAQQPDGKAGQQLPAVKQTAGQQTAGKQASGLAASPSVAKQPQNRIASTTSKPAANQPADPPVGGNAAAPQPAENASPANDAQPADPAKPQD